MSRRILKTAIASVIVLIAMGGYFVYNLIAAQGQEKLVQAPLNNGTPVPPAFIVVVDDSNSMTFERIFKGGDGRLQWNASNSSFLRLTEVSSIVRITALVIHRIVMFTYFLFRTITRPFLLAWLSLRWINLVSQDRPHIIQIILILRSSTIRGPRLIGLCGSRLILLPHGRIRAIPLFMATLVAK